MAGLVQIVQEISLHRLIIILIFAGATVFGFLNFILVNFSTFGKNKKGWFFSKLPTSCSGCPREEDMQKLVRKGYADGCEFKEHQRYTEENFKAILKERAATLIDCVVYEPIHDMFKDKYSDLGDSTDVQDNDTLRKECLLLRDKVVDKVYEVVKLNHLKERVADHSIYEYIRSEMAKCWEELGPHFDRHTTKFSILDGKECAKIVDKQREKFLAESWVRWEEYLNLQQKIIEHLEVIRVQYEGRPIVF